MKHEKAYMVDPINYAMPDGFFITRNQDAIKIKDGVAYVNGIKKTLAAGTVGIAVDEEKYNRTFKLRTGGVEHTDALTAEPPRF